MDYSQFRHWSPKEIKQIDKFEQDFVHFKPKGLYFAIGNEWVRHCEDTGFAPNTYRFEYKLSPQFKPTKIFKLTKDNELDFLKRYGIDREDEQLFTRIRWNKVSQEYNGIHITDELVHSKETNNGLLWRAFDVETLVLWSTDAILERVET